MSAITQNIFPEIANDVGKSIFAFFELHSLYKCMQVNKVWKKVAEEFIPIKELKKFCHILKAISLELGFTIDPYQPNENFQKKIDTLIALPEKKNDNLEIEKNELIDIIFEEFSRNSLGYQVPLFGVRGKILATLEVPLGLQNIFFSKLQTFIRQVILNQGKNVLTLQGFKQRMNPRFLEAILEVLKNHQQRFFLQFKEFIFTDEEVAFICETLKTSVVRLELTSKLLSKQAQEQFLLFSKHKTIHAIQTQGQSTDLEL